MSTWERTGESNRLSSGGVDRSGPSPLRRRDGSSARGLIDAGGMVTDTYDMDTFGRELGSTGSTPNSYRYGAAWGYITDPSGFLQLGARYYWPEVGRFVSQDPVMQTGYGRYVYGSDNPMRYRDPRGECPEDDPANKCSEGNPQACCREGATEDCLEDCLAWMGGKGAKASKDEVLAHVAECVANQAAQMPVQAAIGCAGRAAGGRGGFGDFASKVGQGLAKAIGWVKKVFAA